MPCSLFQYYKIFKTKNHIGNLNKLNTQDLRIKHLKNEYNYSLQWNFFWYKSVFDIKSKSTSREKHKKRKLKALKLHHSEIFSVEYFSKHPSIILSTSFWSLSYQNLLFKKITQSTTWYIVTVFCDMTHCHCLGIFINCPVHSAVCCGNILMSIDRNLVII